MDKPDFISDPKTVLITGGARRIGAAIARGLAAQGWHVCIHYHHSKADAQSLKADIIQGGGKASLVQADLASASDCRALFNRARQAAGQDFTALINNASKFQKDSAQDFTADSFAQHMAINLEAPLALAQDFAAQLDSGQVGNIINMIDQRVLKPNPLYFSYSLSKAGLYWATKTLAQAMAPNIRVNAIGPGPSLQSTAQSEQDFAKEAAHTLLGYGSNPQEILAGIDYLLEAKSVTGHMLAIDSGQHLNWQTPDIKFGG